jgi:hypothetical protein
MKRRSLWPVKTRRKNNSLLEIVGYNLSSPPFPPLQENPLFWNHRRTSFRCHDEKGREGKLVWALSCGEAPFVSELTAMVSKDRFDLYVPCLDNSVYLFRFTDKELQPTETPKNLSCTRARLLLGFFYFVISSLLRVKMVRFTPLSQ